MKILYAAGNRLGSNYQLKRFLNSISNKNYNIKVAAYKKSIGDLNVDYTLDCLLNFTNPEGTISFNNNYSYYYNQVKRFSPDLIISDFDIYSSVLANDLNIKLWQYSPINLYYALDNKTKKSVAIHKYYSHIIESDHKKFDYINYVLNNSDRKFVLSHLCDCENAPTLTNNYEYARPSFVLGDDKNKIDNVVALVRSNKKIINEFKDKNSILFSPYVFEKYNKMIVEDINSDVYNSCIGNCSRFITDGVGVFLSDAFYNGHFCFSIPRLDDIESIICSYMNEFCGVGKMEIGKPEKIKIKLDDKVKFISEYLEEF